MLENTFQLSPDLLLLKKHKSKWGGLAKKDKEQLVRVPHQLTPEDLETLLEFFDLVAMQRFMDHFKKQDRLYDEYFAGLATNE